MGELTDLAKLRFILKWCNSDCADLTSYNMNPKVIEYGNTFYPNDNDERKIINNLTSHFRKLVGWGVLEEATCMGAGEGSKNDFFWNYKTISLVYK